MTALATPAATTDTLGALTRCEVLRFVRHPVFVLATLGLIATQGQTLLEPAPEVNNLIISPVIFVCAAGLVTAFALTQSTQRLADTVEVAPVSMTVRTTALCLTSVVPFSVGLITTVATLAFARTHGRFPYGAFGIVDRVGIVSGQIAVPALGAALLGVALGRWVRYPWNGLALFLALCAWVEFVEGLAATYPDNFSVVFLRMFAPYTFFTNGDFDGVDTWRGSPWAFVGWQLCLCAIAVVVALLRGASQVLRRRLVVVLGAVLAMAAVMFVLSAVGGLDHPLVVRPDGSTRPL